MSTPKFSVWLMLAGTVIVLDQGSKWWLADALSPGERVPVTSYFDLVRVMNPGAAFSFLAGAGGWQRWLFVLLALAISGWVLGMLRRHADQPGLAVALALILGGALGNLIDRLRFGAVLDFLDFYWAGWHWPAFNIADSAISVGVGLMLWFQFTYRETDHDRKNLPR